MTSTPCSLFSFIWHLACRQRRRFFFLFLVDSLTWPLDTLLWPYILHGVVDLFTRYDQARSMVWESLSPFIWGAVALSISVEVASRWMGFTIAKALPRLQADIRLAMFDPIQRHSPRYFNDRFAGGLANQITEMATHVEAIFARLFWPLVPSLGAAILGCFFLGNVHPLFAWLLIGWTIVHFGLSFAFSRFVGVYEHRHSQIRSTLLGHIVDSLTNNFAVNLFYRFKEEKARIALSQSKEEQASRRARSYVEKMRSWLSLSYVAAVIFGIFGSVVHLWIADAITTGQVVQVFASLWSFAMMLWAASSELPAVFQSLGIVKQAYTTLQDPEDLGDVPHASPLILSQGSIIFDNVSFHYGEKRLFHNRHVVIQGGERIGLVGYSGAGKSTFVNLILRLFPLEGGRILIDNQEIACVTLASLRRQIALIPQDPVLFHRTLWENIAYGRPTASEDEVYEAARLAHCHEFISKLPQGYASMVGERGTKLSGGEKQRIAIARAILANTPILILDEATSSLDSLTEQYIQESLANLMQGKTTLVVAHRLSTLSKMDRLLVFNEGEIVEDGKHEHLLSANGLYARMWKMQVGGFLPEGPL